MAILASQASQLNKQASSAGSNVDALLSSLDRYGAEAGLLATGVYSFSDLDIIQRAKSLTNALCSRFMSSNVSQSQFQQRVATEMAKILPVPSSGISFASGLQCGPYYPFQTRPDQRAAFSVQGMSIKTMYTRFGSNANYVTYSSANVDHSAQPFEITAPLSAANVKLAMNTALRIVVLGVLQQSLSLWDDYIFDFPFDFAFVLQTTRRRRTWRLFRKDQRGQQAFQSFRSLRRQPAHWLL